MKRELLNVFPQLDATGDFVFLNPVDNIVVEIMTVLISSNGERSTRMWNIEFGAGILDYLFALASEDAVEALSAEVLNSLRINIPDVQFDKTISRIEKDESGNVISIMVDVVFSYDDKKYLSRYYFPRTISLLEGPLYDVHQVDDPKNYGGY